MTRSFIETEPVAVTTAGGNVASMAGDWSEWATSAESAFGDAAEAVCNAHLGMAVSDHSATWNPVAQRVAGRVSTLGSNISTAAGMVDDADVNAAHLLADQVQAPAGDSLLARSIPT